MRLIHQTAGPGFGLRSCMIGTILLLVLHPWSPVTTWVGNWPLTLSLSCFLAALVLFEFVCRRWTGAAGLQLAVTHFRQGRLSAARRTLKRVVRLNRRPDVSSRACGLLAAVEVERARFPEAFGWIRRSREIAEGRSAKAHHLALEALIHHLLCQPRSALSRLESASALHPAKPVRGLIQLVRASLFLFEEKNTLNSLKRLDRASAAMGHPLVDRYFPVITGLALAESGHVDEARATVANAPRSLGLTTFVRGRILHLEGDHESAVAAYETALEELAEGFLLFRAVCRFHLGSACLEVGKTREGSRQMCTALRAPLPESLRAAAPRPALDATSRQANLGFLERGAGDSGAKETFKTHECGGPPQKQETDGKAKKSLDPES